MQSAEIDVATRVSLLRSLKTVLSFDEYEARGMEISDNKEYKSERHRKRRKKSDNSENAHDFNAKEDFRVNTFNVIIDKLSSELGCRMRINEDIDLLFSVLIDGSLEMSYAQSRMRILTCCLVF